MWPGVEYGYLANIAGDVEAAMDGLFFLPHLAGERTPYMDPGLRAAFIGLSLRHSQAHLVRGAMEGVVFAMRQGLDLMVSLGTPVERLIASGGSTRHPLWLQLQADIFDRPIYVSNTTEVTARGAAILAGIGAGVYRDFGHGLRLAVREPDRVIRPDPTRARRYGFAYRDFLLWSQMIADRYRVDEIT
jgi:xylulokinase